jgi:hypothetical protein
VIAAPELRDDLLRGRANNRKSAMIEHGGDIRLDLHDDLAYCSSMPRILTTMLSIRSASSAGLVARARPPSKGRRAFRRGIRGPRRATQPLVLPRLSAISAPCTSADRVQKRRGRGDRNAGSVNRRRGTR